MLGFVLGLGLSACAQAGPAFAAGRTDHGQLQKVGRVWMLTLRGTPEQRGQAAGKLVGEQVRWLLPRYLRAALGRARLPAEASKKLAALAADLPDAHRRQIDALARSAGVDPDALLAVNLATELSLAPACSCLATEPDRSPDGRVRLARNLDWLGGQLLSGLGLVVVESGPGIRTFASFTWPGLVGAVTGMNESGLSVADLMAYPGGRRKLRPGRPVLFVVRSLLEQAGSVEQALELLREQRRTMPQNYALADPADARVAETGPRRFRVRRPRLGLVAITNFYDEDKSPRPRYAGMMAEAGQGKLGPEELKSILRSVALGDLNVQAAVLEPATRVVHLSTGKAPAAEGPWVRLDLAPWLQAPERSHPEP